MVDILAGVRVIEVGQVLAGPYAGAILADLGADVIKVERHDGGDDARHMGPAFRHDDALTFHIYNRGKKSVALDLTTAPGKAAFNELVATADIMLHNLRPGVPAKLGIDGPTLCARYPRLIYCEISAFGHTGPLADRPGFEPLIQAYSGLCAINGGPDDPPMRAGPSVCDQGTGMWVVLGALAMLQKRQRTGKGGIVSASLLETALMWCGQKVDALVNTGTMPPRHRMGHPGLVPYEAFEAADGPFMICAGNDRLFAKLADVLGRPDWITDLRFAGNRGRLINKMSLFEEMAPILATRPRAHWIAALDAAGVPATQIHSVEEAQAQPHVRALGMAVSVPGEDFSLTGLPLSFDGERPQFAHGAPRLGQDNAALGVAPATAD
ncbi:MAG TPA: CoA transferase [Stellaceae bacterium]|nr:CoA transferase [Stellaceae bacterium]